MRVLFVSNYYPPFEVGGYEQLCRDVAEALAARGHQVEILTCNRGAGEQVPPGACRVHRALRLLPDYESKVGPAIQFFVSRRGGERHNLASLRQVAEAFRPDVVLFWNLEGLPTSLAMAAEALPGVAVAYWVAGRSPAEPEEFWRYWSAPARSPLKRAAKWCAARVALGVMRSEGHPRRPAMRHLALVSEYMRQQALDAGTVPEDARVIYNGVEVQHFHRSREGIGQDGLRILYAGRLSADKGVHTLIEALAIATQGFGSAWVQLTLAGKGPDDYLADLQRQVVEGRLTDRVTFLGWVPREAMPDLMAEHDVLVLPTTHQEPFARVVLEAMASGLVVVGTVTGGTGEILKDGETGLTFEAGDAGGLARQLGRLSRDPALCWRLARAGQRLVADRFSLERMVDNIEGFLASAYAEQVGDGSIPPDEADRSG